MTYLWIFDNLMSASCTLDNDADGFGRFRLDYRFISTIGLQRVAKPDKGWISYLDQWVVNTIKVTTLDALWLELFDNAFFSQCIVDPAISIRRSGNGWFAINMLFNNYAQLKSHNENYTISLHHLRFHHNFSSKIKARQCSLIEKANLILGQTEIVIFDEEAFCLFPSRAGCHDV